MPSIYLRSPLHEDEGVKLKKEFPYYRFLNERDFAQNEHPQDLWRDVEILFGDHLSKEELSSMPQLKWIHMPHADLHHCCYEEIRGRENILVTVTQDRFAEQVAEWALATYFAFSKNLFLWSRYGDIPPIVKAGSTLIPGQKWLQIGLDTEGAQIASKAKLLGFNVLGVSRSGSFSPGCTQVYSMDKLHTQLPKADVISFFCKRQQKECPFLTKEDIELMKPGVILLLFCRKERLDLLAFISSFKAGFFRGVAIDSSDPDLLKALEPLKDDPRLLLTPNVSTYPHPKETHSFHLFRHNLRQFIHNNVQDMKLLLNS